ncbi:MAG: metal-dependent transcriptional regulator [Candidatus Poseidoniales archaeon]
MVGHFQEFEDEYLEMMYECYEEDPTAHVRTGELAEKLSVSPASVTEMLRRLASKELVIYTPYKGARLTDAGLEHGQRMKRRHRLAELLLDILPFDGNAHETACRLEHAIDDDLEVSLSLLFSNASEDPSGREIPEADVHIKSKLKSIKSVYALLSDIPDNTTCIVSALFFSQQEKILLSKQGIELGTNIVRRKQQLQLDDSSICQLDNTLMSKIMVKIVE